MSLLQKVDGKMRTLFRWRRGRPLEGPQVDNTLEAPEDIVALPATCVGSRANRTKGVQHLAELGLLMEIYLDVSSTHAPTLDEGGSNHATSLNMDSFLSSCSEDDSDSDSGTTSVVSFESGWKSCSTACSMSSHAPDASWDWQTHTRRGYSVTTHDTTYPNLLAQEPHRVAYGANWDYQRQQFAADRFSINAVEVEEGWTGMVVWPRRMNRAAEHRLPPGPIRPLQAPRQEQQPRLVRHILSL